MPCDFSCWMYALHYINPKQEFLWRVRKNMPFDLSCWMYALHYINPNREFCDECRKKCPSTSVVGYMRCITLISKAGIFVTSLEKYMPFDFSCWIYTLHHINIHSRIFVPGVFQKLCSSALVVGCIGFDSLLS